MYEGRFFFHVKGETWRPIKKVITKTLNWLSEVGSVEDVRAFVSLLRTVIPANEQMYHALISAHVREGKELDELLESMAADDIRG